MTTAARHPRAVALIRTLFAIVPVLLAVAGCREILEFDEGNPPGSGAVIVWERTSGPDGEAILALRVDQTGTLYAGAESGRLFRTVTDGRDWTPVPLPVTGGAITAILVDPLRRIFLANDLHGVLQSSDGGVSWTSINDGLADSAITAIAYLPTGELAAGSARGTLSITGSGSPLWSTRVSFGRAVTSLLPLSSEELLVGTWNSGVFRYRPVQGTSTAVNSGLQDLYVNVLHLGTSGFLYAGTRGSGAYRSEAGSIFWQNAGGGSIGREVTAFRTTQFGELFAGTGTGVFLSTDAGQQWTRLENGLGQQEVRALAVNENATVFAGTVNGVYRTVRVTSAAAARPRPPGSLPR